MKWIGRVLVALFVVIIILLVIPFFVPVESYRGQIQSLASENLCREVELKGDMDFSIIPSLAVRVEDVTVSNMPGASDPQMASLKELVLNVKLLPLLSGKVAVDRFVLVEPVMNLEVASNGTANWEFCGGSSSAASSGGSGGGAGPADVSLGEAGISDGQISYTDKTTGIRHELRDVNISVVAPSSSSPLNVDGSMLLNGTPLKVEINAKRFGALLSGETTPFDMEIDSDPLSFTYDGEVRSGAPMKLDGEIELVVPDPAALSAWTAGKQIGEPAPQAVEEGPREWSDEPLDLSGLKGQNASLNLIANTLQFGEIKVDKAQVTGSLKNGVLKVNLAEMELYKGTGKGGITLDGSGSAARLSSDFKLAEVNVGNLMNDAMGMDAVTGTGNIEFDISGAGRSEKALVSSLGGQGAILFTDGAIKGFNIAAAARGIKSLMSDPTALVAKKTDFAELGGTFTMTGGVARTNDFRLLNPLVRVDGSGNVNLPTQKIDMTMKPRVVGSLEGQGAEGEEGGLGVPLKISGSMYSPSIMPDIAGTFLGGGDGEGGNPIEGLKEGFGGLLGGSKKGDDEAAPAEAAPAEAEPEQ